MTDNIFRIEPELQFPIGEVFQIPDHYNGHKRGTYYYRSIFPPHNIRGPFHTPEEASFRLVRDDDGS